MAKIDVEIKIKRDRSFVMFDWGDLPDYAEITGRFVRKGEADHGRPGDSTDNIVVLEVRKETVSDVRKKLEGKEFQWADLIDVRFPDHPGMY